MSESLQVFFKQKQLPRDAYRYWPASDEVLKGSGKKSVRFIFEQQTLTEFEKNKLDRLLLEIKDGKIEGTSIPKDWSPNHLLRFCYGTGWKTRNAIKALIAHIQFRNSVLSCGYVSLYPKISKLLNSGVFYVHGRDYRFRPLLVMNFALINFKEVRNIKHSIDEYTNTLCYILEYTIEKLLLPGQIENWMVLTDLGKNGLGNLSVSSLKQVLHILQANYRCRLAINYIINPPKSIWVLWSCIKPFLDDITIDKIKISNASYSQEMLGFFNPSQVEERYGGKAPNLNVFWPPVMPESGFDVEGKKIILSDKDSYFQYNPNNDPVELEVIAADPEPKPSMRPSLMGKERKNSLNVNFENSDVEIEDLEADVFARSDNEEVENLIDFEMASPFTRLNKRNPTFLSFNKMNSQDFQKRISIKVFQLANGSDPHSDSLESSLDFEPIQPSLIEVRKEPEHHIEIFTGEEPNCDDHVRRSHCGKLDCGVFKNSCNIF